MPMSAATSFDAVVMLTWSDWHTEPRSNRYHFAVQFARRWPTFFVQTSGAGDSVTFEPVEGHDITIVRIPPQYGPEACARLAAALRERGVTRPLVWVYSLLLAAAAPRLQPALVVYHATEDYLAKADSVAITPTDMSQLARAAIDRADLVVAVSQGVARTHRAATDKPVVVMPNGCDFTAWHETDAFHYARPPEGKVALYQGGINSRLDFALLTRLSELLPDWQFWFCGKAGEGGAEWEALQKRRNIVYHGELDTRGIASLAKRALVGLIPFKDSDLMRRSLPLKAYEYLACGLPVITTPIEALEAEPGLFSVARSAEEFVDAIQLQEGGRANPESLSLRLEAARAASYDVRFDELMERVQEQLTRQSMRRPRLNVLMIYDDGSTLVNTIYEHLDAFSSHSIHKFHFLSATDFVSLAYDDGSIPNFHCYDALIIHYSVRVSVPQHIAPDVVEMVRSYRGPKLLFIQDEYDKVETSRLWMERLGVDAVFTNVPHDSLEFVYPRSRFPNVDFIPTLTGYVPEDPDLDNFIVPMAERDLRIAYRGRSLPHHYGALAREKYLIGVEMRRLALKRGIRADIEVAEDKRIYGADWYRFIGSARATLGTESGCNVFDMDGHLSQLAKEHAEMPFDVFAESYLKEHEGLVRMNQISPKIFEAIRLRTALVLFEGDYSGAIRPEEHYIPLRKDYSNVDEVFERLEDVRGLEMMTERAYRDVIGSGKYTLKQLVEGVDDYIARRAGGRRRATIVSVPVVAFYGDNDADVVFRPGRGALLTSDKIIGDREERDKLVSIGSSLDTLSKFWPDNAPEFHDIEVKRGPFFRLLRLSWRSLPEGARGAIVSQLRVRLNRVRATNTVRGRMARRLGRYIGLS
jgi:glycosyltransferase involved in cell wall biosynthesis